MVASAGFIYLFEILGGGCNNVSHLNSISWLTFGNGTHSMLTDIKSENVRGGAGKFSNLRQGCSFLRSRRICSYQAAVCVI